LIAAQHHGRTVYVEQAVLMLPIEEQQFLYGQIQGRIIGGGEEQSHQSLSCSVNISSCSGNSSGCSTFITSLSSQSGRTTAVSQKSFAPEGSSRRLKLYTLRAATGAKRACLASDCNSSVIVAKLQLSHTSVCAKF